MFADGGKTECVLLYFNIFKFKVKHGCWFNCRVIKRR